MRYKIKKGGDTNVLCIDLSYKTLYHLYKYVLDKALNLALKSSLTRRHFFTNMLMSFLWKNLFIS